ncbi:MAG: hypothetical protein C6W54_09425 [Bacillaceae bacterium]|nr:MAG: hypothetical protein C6W54_09425 [Bacillaceae bacterium]
MLNLNQFKNHTSLNKALVFFFAHIRITAITLIYLPPADRFFLLSLEVGDFLKAVQNNFLLNLFPFNMIQ